MTQELTTERLTLRPFEEADGARVVSLLNDYAVSKWLARVPHPFRFEDLRLVDETGGSRWPDLAAITAQGAVIGGMSLRADHLGYWIGAAYWGRRFASEAVTAAVQYIFRDRIAEIRSAVFEGNEASHRILIGRGFRETGRDLDPCLARGEDIRNVSYCLTRADWEATA